MPLDVHLSDHKLPRQMVTKMAQLRQQITTFAKLLEHSKP